MTDAKHCTQCGEHAQPSANCCERCGSRLAAATENGSSPPAFSQEVQVSAPGFSQESPGEGVYSVTSLGPIPASAVPAVSVGIDGARQLSTSTGTPAPTALPDLRVVVSDADVLARTCDVCDGTGNVESLKAAKAGGAPKKKNQDDAKGKDGKDALETCLTCAGSGKLVGGSPAVSSADAVAQRGRVLRAKAALAEMRAVSGLIKVPARILLGLVKAAVFTVGGVAYFWGVGALGHEFGNIGWLSAFLAPVPVFLAPLYMWAAHGDWFHAAAFYVSFVGFGIPLLPLETALKRGFIRSEPPHVPRTPASVRLLRLTIIGTIVVAVTVFAVARIVMSQIVVSR